MTWHDIHVFIWLPLSGQILVFSRAIMGLHVFLGQDSGFAPRLWMRTPGVTTTRTWSPVMCWVSKTAVPGASARTVPPRWVERVPLGWWWQAMRQASVTVDVGGRGWPLGIRPSLMRFYGDSHGKNGGTDASPESPEGFFVGECLKQPEGTLLRIASQMVHNTGCRCRKRIIWVLIYSFVMEFIWI